MIVRDFALGGRWYVLTVAYPTGQMAKRAWERLERKLNLSAGDEGIGIYRLTPNPAGGRMTGAGQEPAVACVTLDQPTAEKAQRLLLDGREFDPAEDFADALIARRARVVLQHQGQTGRLVIRRPEDKGGALDPKGQMYEQGAGEG